jgi:hypothetical protein
MSSQASKAVEAAETNSPRIQASRNTEKGRTTLMRKQKPTSPTAPIYVPGRRYPGLRGKVVDWVEHKFEEGLLYIHVRFVDKTELCWRIVTRMAVGAVKSEKCGLDCGLRFLEQHPVTY